MENENELKYGKFRNISKVRNEERERSQMENPRKIIFFRDSITREYTPIFEKVLKEEYSDKEIEIINAGVIGETSRDGLKRIDHLIDESPQVVVIGFGMKGRK